MTSKDLCIHLGSFACVAPGKFHLLCAPCDYAELQQFFSSHFDTVSATHDDIGFPDGWYKCPKGTMFVRDEKGELVRAK